MSAVTNLPNIALTFHDFRWLSTPGNEILKFYDFPGFPWPVETLFDFLAHHLNETTFALCAKDLWRVRSSAKADCLFL